MTILDTPTPETPTGAAPATGRAAVVGLLAAAVALAAGELVAAATAPSPSPVAGVANRFIDGAPSWLVELGKNVFGTANKPALAFGIVAVALALGAGLGVLAVRRRAAAELALVAFGALGWWAVAADPQGTLFAGLVSSGAATVAGVVALRWLLYRADPRSSPRPARGLDPTTPPVDRRSFLRAAGLVGAGAAATAAVGRGLRSARSVAESARADVVLTTTDSDVAEAVARAGSGTVAGTPGISPLVVPNDEFYRIDTALLLPQVDPADWSMTIDGMVDTPIEISYPELLERATTVAPVTLSCVSNEVGGPLVGNAIWQGVPLVDLLEEAGVDPESATQIVGHSVDGWTAGFPTAAVFDERTALVAVGMNDEPLPIRHGFPARLVVSGLYGYVSATKWLSRIELTTLEAFDGYWIPRGWSKRAPVKTQSRIDTPTSGTSVASGASVPIGGVAWAPDLGIERVEVKIGDADWTEAQLGESLGSDAWRQWRIDWIATPGEHLVQVRATDGSGTTQTEAPAPPAPDGASGWHTIRLYGD